MDVPGKSGLLKGEPGTLTHIIPGCGCFFVPSGSAKYFLNGLERRATYS